MLLIVFLLALFDLVKDISEDFAPQSNKCSRLSTKSKRIVFNEKVKRGMVR